MWKTATEQLILRALVKGCPCFSKSILLKSMLVTRCPLKYVHDSILQKALQMKLMETLNWSTALTLFRMPGGKKVYYQFLPCNSSKQRNRLPKKPLLLHYLKISRSHLVSLSSYRTWIKTTGFSRQIFIKLKLWSQKNPKVTKLWSYERICNIIWAR